jgi:hypothetical protein
MLSAIVLSVVVLIVMEKFAATMPQKCSSNTAIFVQFSKANHFTYLPFLLTYKFHHENAYNRDSERTFLGVAWLLWVLRQIYNQS